MLVKKVESDPVKQLSVSIHESTHKLIDAYMTMYEEVYGEAIQKGALVDELLKHLLTKQDKDFVKWYVKNQKRLDKEAESTSNEGKAGDDKKESSPSSPVSMAG